MAVEKFVCCLIRPPVASCISGKVSKDGHLSRFFRATAEVEHHAYFAVQLSLLRCAVRHERRDDVAAREDGASRFAGMTTALLKTS
jgi:hypothetical protein